MIYFQIVIIQVIIFTVVILFLKKMMVGSTESALNRLKESYAEIAEKKEELVLKIQQVEEEYQRRRAEAERIADKIREEAELEMSKKEEEILKKAKQQAEKIIVETEAAREEIKAEIRKEERMKIADLCSEILSLTFKESAIDELDKMLVKDFLDEFAEVDISRIPDAITEVEIISLKGLAEQDKAYILTSIEGKLGRVMNVKEEHDPGVLAGIAIKFGGLVLDGTIRGKLKEHTGTIKEKIDKEG